MFADALKGIRRGLSEFGKTEYLIHLELLVRDTDHNGVEGGRVQDHVHGSVLHVLASLSTCFHFKTSQSALAFSH